MANPAAVNVSSNRPPHFYTGAISAVKLRRYVFPAFFNHARGALLIPRAPALTSIKNFLESNGRFPYNPCFTTA